MSRINNDLQCPWILAHSGIWEQYKTHKSKNKISNEEMAMLLMKK